MPLTKFSRVKYVLKDDSAACVGSRRKLLNPANNYNLHLNDTIAQLLIGYPIRQEWPFENRWNILISRLVKSDLIVYDLMDKANLLLEKRKFYTKEKENQGFTVIELEDLAFAFAILGIGLAGATVIFFVEVWRGRRSSNWRNFVFISKSEELYKQH